MGKKMITKFPFLFKATETTTGATTSAAAPSPWPWPACVNNPKTLSFRANNDDIYKTMNSAYLHDKNLITPDSERFSYASETDSFYDEESVVVTGMRSERLFFEPGETSSILQEVAKTYDFPYKETVAITAMDSNDPFVDFRVSMEEMVEAHGLKDWECLEELLTCYLRVNCTSNHGYIVGAFIDLLMNLALADSNEESLSSAIDEPCCSSSSTATHHYSFTSPLSFSSSTYSSTSPCLSSLENIEDEIVEEKI